MGQSLHSFLSKLIVFFAWCSLGILSSNVSADYAAAVLADNPLGYWRFNEADGDKAVNLGTAGSELDGEYIDAPRVDGPDQVGGKAITGLGAGNLAIRVGDEFPDPSYVFVDASPMNDVETDPGFSFEGWVNPDERLQDRVGLWGQNDVPEFGFINPQRIQLWTPSSSVDWDFTEDDLVDGEWFHIAATSSFEETILYINGEEVQVGPGSGNETFGFSDFTFNIGGGGVYDPLDVSNGNQFIGLIDEVAIWTDRVLTDSEIAAHYNAAFEGVVGGDFDYDANGSLGVGDVDLLRDQIIAAGGDLKFDANGDGAVDAADLKFYVTDASVLNTWVGDANLDGEFSSSDFVAVFQAGLFETGNPATWATGDWNADGVFGSGDFVAAFQDGGFEMGPKGAVASVPEPASLVLLLIGVLGLTLRRRN